jgi:hypothetical protein
VKLYNRNDLYIKYAWDGGEGDEIDMCVMQGGKKVRKVKGFKGYRRRYGALQDELFAEG